MHIHIMEDVVNVYFAMMIFQGNVSQLLLWASVLLVGASSQTPGILFSVVFSSVLANCKFRPNFRTTEIRARIS
jgi:hypothetical protein